MRTKYSSLAWCAVLAGLGFLMMAPVTSERGRAGGRFQLEIDGQGTAMARAVEGGNMYAEVVTQKAGQDGVAHKSVGAIKVSDLEVELAVTDMTGFLSNALSKPSTRYNGKVLSLDFDNKVVKQRDFTNAIVTELTVPEMDGASKETGYFTVKLRPESVKTSGAGGKASSDSKKGSKPWNSGNFRMNIDGLENVTVSKIESFTLKQNVAETAVGSRREPTKEAGGWVVPNLVFSVPESQAKSFVDWFNDFVVKGKTELKKNGKIELLSQDMKSVLLTLEAKGLGIVAVRDGESTSGDEKVRRVEVECFVEQWTITPGK